MPAHPTPISVIINEQSGAAARGDLGTEIQALFAAAGCTVRLERVRHGGDISARARQAAARGDVLVAAGGDGTVGGVAGVAVDTNATLGVLPVGTLNHFAKDLGIPLALKDAVATVAGGYVRAVDVGDVNGRIFVNNSSIGIYPRMVWERKAGERHGHSKWTAFTIAMLRTWRNWRTFVARAAIDGEVHVVRTPFIFVGNNEYQVEGFELGARASLDRGRLVVLVAPDCGQFEVLLLPLRALARRLSTDPTFERFAAASASIELSRRRVSVSHDGEVSVMNPPLKYTIRPAALRVLVPSPAPTA